MRDLRDRKEVERTQRQQEQAAAQAQAAFDALSEQGKELHRAEAELSHDLAHAEAEQRAQRPGLIAVLNHLVEAAQSWPLEERGRAADLLERVYDAIGWFDRGKGKKQRQKQEAKRRGAIEALRS